MRFVHWPRKQARFQAMADPAFQIGSLKKEDGWLSRASSKSPVEHALPLCGYHRQSCEEAEEQIANLVNILLNCNWGTAEPLRRVN